MVADLDSSVVLQSFTLTYIWLYISRSIYIPITVFYSLPSALVIYLGNLSIYLALVAQSAIPGQQSLNLLPTFRMDKEKLAKLQQQVRIGALDSHLESDIARSGEREAECGMWIKE